MKKLAAVLAIMFCAAACVHSEELPKIAVAVTGGLSDGEKRVLGTEILNALVKSGRYIAVERADAFVEQIDAELLTQMSGAVDDGQISEAGKKFGVDYICITDVTMAFEKHQLSARILDVESAEVIYIGKAYGLMKDMRTLTVMADNVVLNLFDITVNEPDEWKNYTVDQRFRTWTWNLIPFLAMGSTGVMDDLNGAYVHLSIATAGFVLILTGLLGDNEDINNGLMATGAVIWVGGGTLWNLFRSATFEKPGNPARAGKQGAAAEKPAGHLNLAVLPTAEGNLKACAMYRLEF